jgi:hypothetical protein
MPRPRKEVTENQRRSIVAKYIKGPPGNGLKQIGDSFDPSLTVAVVRRVLETNGVEIRGRGRPCLAEA